MTREERILIVDDERANIDLLSGILTDYIKKVAYNGEQALKAVQSKNPPDLILLDVMMPGIDGYEVCQRMKANEQTRHIPIIFISAKSSVEDEIKGFEMGAVDYIAKPISPPMVLARVKNCLALRSAYRTLENQHTELKEMAQLRHDVETIIRHDLKSPVNGIIGCTKLLLTRDNLAKDKLAQFHQIIQDSAEQLLKMINNSLDLVKMERDSYQVAFQEIDFVPLIKNIFFSNNTIINRKNIGAQLLVRGHNAAQTDEHFFVQADEMLCLNMISNLFLNALEASPVDQPVTVSLYQDSTKAYIDIHNQGLIPESIRDRFFEKYVTANKKGGTGLGTYSARLMARTQKGDIKVSSTTVEGTIVSISMPLSQS